MIEENARVIRVEEDGFAWVETLRQTACGSCSASSGCGTSVISKLFGDKRTRVRVIDPLGVKLGEEVIVGIDESALLRSSLMVYILPLLCLVGAALLGQLVLGFGETGVVLSGLGGLLSGLVLLALLTRRLRGNRRYQPVVVRRLGQPLKAVAGVFAP